MKMFKQARVLVGLALVAGVALAGCDCGRAEAGADPASIRVRVFERCTANGSGTGPVQGATVSIAPGNQSPTTRVTNAQGETEFTGLFSDAVVTVNAQAPNGTAFPHKTITTTPGENVVVLCLITGSVGGN